MLLNRLHAILWGLSWRLRGRGAAAARGKLTYPQNLKYPYGRPRDWIVLDAEGDFVARVPVFPAHERQFRRVVALSGQVAVRPWAWMGGLL